MECTCTTIESCDYAPLPLCMLALGKTGEGVQCIDHQIPCNLCTFSGCLMGKTREISRQNRTQNLMASLIDVDTVFIWYMDSYIRL